MTSGRGGARWERVEALVELDALGARRVLVVGLGSGGSTVALELAKAGVGRFTLVDPDTLEEQNVVRHECDDRYMGWNKAEAVADLIVRRNPEARIEVVAEDAFALGGRLEEAVRTADLVAGCTDAEAPKLLLNRLSTAAGVPAVYGGVYAGGVGGEVIRCSGGPRDPCYACVTSVLKESAPLPEGEDEMDYGVVEADGPIHGAAGLGMDIRLIALIHAKVCLGVLQGPKALVEAEANVVLFGTAAVEGLFPRPFASALLAVAPQEHCLACTPFRRRAVDDPVEASPSV
jgi:molybdopterin/thiamine biosynthesis adenylyltransferase